VNLSFDPAEFAPLIEAAVDAAVRRLQAERHTDDAGKILLGKAEAAQALAVGGVDPLDVQQGGSGHE